MIKTTPLEFNLATPRLQLNAEEAPWDSAVFGVPVVQIQKVQVLDQKGVMIDYAQFQDWVTNKRIGIVSCRLAHERLAESMFLETNGFRFIEMVLHPQLNKLQALCIPEDELCITPTTEVDLKALCGIAEHAFSHERYHVDHRIDSRLAGQRYGRWVLNSLGHAQQNLIKVMDGERLIGLFIVQAIATHLMYWHLTAIAPQWQGRGYGRRVWLAMLRHHQAEGYDTVTTTISARNIPVLNLYAQLNFRFMSPEMTFHWLRTTK